MSISLAPNYYNDPVGALVDPNGGGSFQNGIFTESGLVGGSPTFATTLLARLVYDAPALANGQSSLVHAYVSVTDNGVTQTDSTPISIDVVTPPSVTPGIANQPVIAGQSLRPFSTTYTFDDDFTGNALDTATIAVTDAGAATDSDGLLTGPGLSKTGVGTYAIAATSYWQLESDLQQLSFTTPTLAAGQTLNPSLSLRVTDVGANLAAGTAASILVIGPAVQSPPVIAGLAASQTVISGNAVDPFASVTVTDGNANPQDTATITVTDGAGAATDANGSFAGETWLTHSATGVYTVTATSPATLTSELDQLSFTPTALSSGESSASTGFQLNVTDTGVSQSASGTTSVVENPIPGVVGGAQLNPNFLIQDETTGQSYSSPGEPYNGPVAGLTNQFVILTSDNVNIKSQIPNTFIEVGYQPGQQNPPVEAGIDVSGGNGSNVLDSYANSTFLVGGSGTDQFYDDTRTLTQNSWSTLVNFHPGDNLTLWGVTQSDFTLDWIGDSYGAPGSTGLTGVFVPNAAGKPEAGVTLAGYTSADLKDGKLTLSYNAINGVNYYSIHAN